MEITPTAIEGVRLLRSERLADARGYFAETFRRELLEREGARALFVQENQALSRDAGTVRGLHFQVPPDAQTKLVRVVRGSALDVVVDLRGNSPSYGQHVAVTLRAEDLTQLYVPRGCAHGYCTLEADTEVCYKVDSYWAPESERGCLWNDPALGIDWPVKVEAAIVSERDRSLPALADLPIFFDQPGDWR